MAISEQSRHELYSKLEAVLGAGEAATLMEHLPAVGWADVATKRDLDVLATTVRGEMAVLRSEFRGEIAGVRGEIAELRGEIGGLKGAVGAQGRSLFFQVLGLQFSSFALFLAAQQLV